MQGECSFAGQPCFFVRLAGCNLRCAWCDTTYAYESGLPRTVADLAQAFAASGLRLAEVTGGEPLLQGETPDLLRALARHGTVLLETNGSFAIAGVPPEARILLDLKCPSSGQSGAMEWGNIERLRPQDEVKFVIADRGDYDWALHKLKLYALPSRCQTVWFGPVFGRLPPADLAAWLLRDRVAARLNLQLHKYIWSPDRRGV